MTPGPIDTPILGKVFPNRDMIAQVREKTIGMIPMKRFGTSEEIAKAVLLPMRSAINQRPSRCWM